MGAKAIGERAMTPAERQRRRRAGIAAGVSAQTERVRQDDAVARERALQRLVQIMFPRFDSATTMDVCTLLETIGSRDLARALSGGVGRGAQPVTARPSVPAGPHTSSHAEWRPVRPVQPVEPALRPLSVMDRIRASRVQNG